MVSSGSLDGSVVSHSTLPSLFFRRNTNNDDLSPLSPESVLSCDSVEERRSRLPLRSLSYGSRLPRFFLTNSVFCLTRPNPSSSSSSSKVLNLFFRGSRKSGVAPELKVLNSHLSSSSSEGRVPRVCWLRRVCWDLRLLPNDLNVPLSQHESAAKLSSSPSRLMLSIAFSENTRLMLSMGPSSSSYSYSGSSCWGRGRLIRGLG
mmetsp:Transcript_33118/g.76313  ORF Transcript_33118/g.76313 Transcript_33118/m.76313 type:complete len:204 (+) Transcript_33118:725-1336(+)